jgi:hypothetical protein
MIEYKRTIPYINMKAEFENKLKELGFSFQCQTDDHYILSNKNDKDRIISIQLICSHQITESLHGSHNGTDIQSIGYFKLKLLPDTKEPESLGFAFQNTSKHCVEFIIIQKKELMKRLGMENWILTVTQKMGIVFWLMPDNHLYETTNIGIEAEWYYLSEGMNGRMADQTKLDYSEFLNNWRSFIMV